MTNTSTIQTKSNGHSLPKSWQWAKLDDVCYPRLSTRDPRNKPEEKFVYVDITSIDGSTKTITEPKVLVGKEAPSRARQVIQVGDVIVSTTRPNLNAVAKISQEFDNQICSTGFCVLHPSQDILDSDFLFHFVRTKDFVQNLSDLVKGALYPAVTDKDVRTQTIPLPPLDEQRRIAKRLNEQMAAVESARKAAEEQLDAARRLSSAYLRNVFENHGWKSANLGSLCTIVRGSSPRPKGDPRYYGGKVPRLMVEDVTRDGMFVTPKVDFLTEEGSKLSRPMKKGDVVIVVSGAPGLPGILSVDACIHDGFVGFRELQKEKILPEFLYFGLQYYRAENDKDATGAIFRNLTTDQVGKFKIPIPALDIQREIVGTLSKKLDSAKDLVAMLESQLAEINRLPASLLREGFAGRV